MSLTVLLIAFSAINASLSLAGTPTSTSHKIDSILKKVYPASDPGAAVLVYKDGKLLLRKGYGLANVELNVPVKPEHRFRLASVTKQFTAIALLKLVEQGKLDLDVDIHTYLPNFPDKGHKISLRQALGHTAGLANYTNNDEFEAASHVNYKIADIFKYFQNDILNFTPDTNWDYSNSGYALAAHIMEKVTGTEFTTLMDELILKPTDMTNSAFYNPDIIVSGTVTAYEKHGDYSPALKVGTWGKADGELYSTVDDMLKWYLALRDNKIVSQQSKQISFTSNKLANGEETKYGLGQFLGRIGDYNTVEHGGNVSGWNAYTMVVPSEDLFVVILSNQESGVVGSAAVQVTALALGISSRRPTTLTLAPNALKAFIGRYQHAPDDVRVITLEDGTLYSRRGSGDKYKLVAMESNRFFFDDEPEIQIQFGEANEIRVQYRNSMDSVAQRLGG